jgi:nitronate monooxygenase
MPFKTRITEMLGIQHPIVCGGMTGVGNAELCAAISNAGGLGLITALNYGTPEGLKKEIAKTRGLTSKPFGVNLTILPAITPPDYDGFAKVIVEEGIKIVETGT